MLIYIKSSFKIEGRINAPKDIPVEFNVSLNDEKFKVYLLKDENQAEVVGTIEANEEDINFVKTALIKEGMPEKIKNVLDLETKATEKVLTFFKYYLSQTCLSEGLIALPPDYYWSFDGIGWEDLMPGLVYANINFSYDIPPKKTDLEGIQECLNNNCEPFLAFKHLLRAKQENNPRYSWIDATIALELAIKEFLIRFKPDIETLLLEVPSPPLHKLYGSVLESLTGKRAPNVKEIQKGAEKRNELIHRPKEHDLTQEKVKQYIKEVEIAIYHLLSILYPDNQYLKQPSLREDTYKYNASLSVKI